jgi:hypothetical protein
VKKHEYFEGQQAVENFEKGMKSLFKAPKVKVGKAESKTSLSSRTKMTKSDKD